MAGKKSGVYQILLPSGIIQVYCEMDINGGGYTFLSEESLSKINQSDIDVIFTNKSNVLLRLLKPNASQPYTVIEQYIKTGGLSVQLNAFVNYTKPKNHLISDFLFLGILPKQYVRQNQIEGFISNGISITFNTCDVGGNNYMAFLSAKTAIYTNLIACDGTQMDTKWRGTAKSPEISSKMPLNFFMLTEFHFGGCGCYVESGSWPGRANPANATAIGMR